MKRVVLQCKRYTAQRRKLLRDLGAAAETDLNMHLIKPGGREEPEEDGTIPALHRITEQNMINN